MHLPECNLLKSMHDKYLLAYAVSQAHVDFHIEATKLVVPMAKERGPKERALKPTFQ